MNKKGLYIVIFFLLAAAAGLGFLAAKRIFFSGTPAAAEKAVYYCPMHPDFTSDRPGKCGICGMDLVKAETSSPDQESGSSGEEGVYISPERQQLIGVAADVAKYRRLKRIIRAAGKIAYDPDLYNAQVEYLEALRAGEKTKDSTVPEIAANAKSLVSSARLRLTLLGLGEEQIKELERKNSVSENLLLG
ncbi:hypothetical protein EHM76_04135, partial [bacterium]